MAVNAELVAHLKDIQSSLRHLASHLEGVETWVQITETDNVEARALYFKWRDCVINAKRAPVYLEAVVEYLESGRADEYISMIEEFFYE